MNDAILANSQTTEIFIFAVLKTSKYTCTTRLILMIGDTTKQSGSSEGNGQSQTPRSAPITNGLPSARSRDKSHLHRQIPVTSPTLWYSILRLVGDITTLDLEYVFLCNHN